MNRGGGPQRSQHPDEDNEIDYLDRQLNAVAMNPEFKLSDLNNETNEQPVHGTTTGQAVEHQKEELQEEDFNSLENRLKNIRKNLNFDQAFDQVNKSKAEQKSNSNDCSQEFGIDSFKDRY